MEDSIFGCFIKIGFDPSLSEEEALALARQFTGYIWGSAGVGHLLKSLRREAYGQDVALVLFQFFVKPAPNELDQLLREKPYRKREKSIALSIVVTNDNFFDKSDEERYAFLKQSVLQKVDLLKETVTGRKLDTKVEKLMFDLRELLGFKTGESFRQDQ